MENIPYLVTELSENINILNDSINAKIKYLTDVNDSIINKNDLELYRLLNSDRDHSLIYLIDDLKDETSHYLGINLINYLSKEFPFFFYEENEKGIFEIYFGNWWDRRFFGILDATNITFNLDDEKYKQLEQSFLLSEKNQRYNTNKIQEKTDINKILQKIIDEQEKRDIKRIQLINELKTLDEQKSGLFGSKVNNEERQKIENQLNKLDDIDKESIEAPAKIKDNNEHILKYSKEDTILLYEQKAIKDKYNNFNNFKDAIDNIHNSYIKFLKK